MARWQTGYPQLLIRRELTRVDPIRSIVTCGSLRRLVREHFRMAYDNELNGNDTMLAEMPLSLRREVMRDIMMPVLRHAPICAHPARAHAPCTLCSIAPLAGPQALYCAQTACCGPSLGLVDQECTTCRQWSVATTASCPYCARR